MVVPDRNADSVLVGFINDHLFYNHDIAALYTSPSNVYSFLPGKDLDLHIRVQIEICLQLNVIRCGYCVRDGFLQCNTVC